MLLKKYAPTLGLWLLLTIGMTYWTFHALGSHLTPEGDLAADMLLVDQLREKGYLLLGHYSRWGFNHPGPFWFYLNYGLEQGLKGSGLWRFQIWSLGHLLLTTVFLTLTAIPLSTYLLRRVDLGFCLFCVATLVGFMGLEMTLLWMPWRIVLPYLCFLVAILHLIEGNRLALPWSIFLTGTLIHGYITMPIFTLPLLLVSAGLGHWKSGFLGEKQGAISLLASALIGGCFCLPLFLEALRAPPTNFSHISDAQASFRYMPRPDFDEMIGFAGSLLRLRENHSAWIVSLGLLVLVPRWRFLSEEKRRRMRMVLLLCFGVSVLVLGYYAWTPSPLYPFVAQFYVGVPPLIMVTVGALAFHSPHRSRETNFSWASWLWRLGPVALLALTLVMGLQRPGPGDPGEAVRSLVDALESRMKSDPIGFNLIHHEHWPVMAGVILELANRGRSSCVIDRSLRPIMTLAHTCAVDQMPDVDLVRKEQCEGSCFAVAGEYGLRQFILPETQWNEVLGERSKAFFNGTFASDGSWWSNADASLIFFNLKEAPKSSALLKMNLRGLWPQRVQVLINGQSLWSQEISRARQAVSLQLPADMLRQGANVLSIILPKARRPRNGDMRELAIIVDSVVLSR